MVVTVYFKLSEDPLSLNIIKSILLTLHLTTDEIRSKIGHKLVFCCILHSFLFSLECSDQMFIISMKTELVI